MAIPLKYKTIAAAADAEFRDRGSRFIAYAHPVQQIEEAKSLIKRIKAGHSKANHHCIAYRIGHDGATFRASDDGEPSGSAGRPMLGAIDSAGLTNVLVVVVRYFGGTLLGVPGLIHAYGTTAAASLKKAGVLEAWVEKKMEIECDYATMSEVLRIVRMAEGRVLHQDLQLFCVIRAAIPLHLTDVCACNLSELRGVTVKAIS